MTKDGLQYIYILYGAEKLLILFALGARIFRAGSVYMYSLCILYMYIYIAVKFGRMSKKQREKVEDEVRFHRAQMRAQNDAAPDSSVFDTPTPSSSDQLHQSYNG